MQCDCDLPMSGERIYDCPNLPCRMTPSWCKLYQTKESYQAMWDSGKCLGKIDKQAAEQLAEQRASQSRGTGTELKRLLAKFGITPSGCRCNALAMLMDSRGTAWCRDNVNKLADDLRESAKERDWPLAWAMGPPAKLLVLYAIRLAETQEKNEPTSGCGKGCKKHSLSRGS